MAAAPDRNGWPCVGGPLDSMLMDVPEGRRTFEIVRQVPNPEQLGEVVTETEHYVLDSVPITEKSKLPIWRYFKLTHSEAVLKMRPLIWSTMKETLIEMLQIAEDMQRA